MNGALAADEMIDGAWAIRQFYFCLPSPADDKQVKRAQRELERYMPQMCKKGAVSINGHLVTATTDETTGNGDSGSVPSIETDSESGGSRGEDHSSAVE